MTDADLNEMTDLELRDEAVDAEASIRYYLERVEAQKARLAAIRREQNRR